MSKKRTKVLLRRQASGTRDMEVNTPLSIWLLAQTRGIYVNVSSLVNKLFNSLLTFS